MRRASEARRVTRLMGVKDLSGRTMRPPPCENGKCDPHAPKPLPPPYSARHLARISDGFLASRGRSETPQSKIIMIKKPPLRAAQSSSRKTDGVFVETRRR